MRQAVAAPPLPLSITASGVVCSTCTSPRPLQLVCRRPPVAFLLRVSCLQDLNFDIDVKLSLGLIKNTRIAAKMARVSGFRFAALVRLFGPIFCCCSYSHCMRHFWHFLSFFFFARDIQFAVGKRHVSDFKMASLLFSKSKNKIFSPTFSWDEICHGLIAFSMGQKKNQYNTIS